MIPCKPLLEFIARHESGGDYNIVWAGIAAKDRPPRPLVSMMIADVLKWQDSIDHRYASEAAGAYQILEDTLREIYRPAGFAGDDLFNQTTQDMLAVHLLRRRGLRRYMIGEISAERFGNLIAREWASMPVLSDTYRGNVLVKRGASYYSGDGLNKAGPDPDEFLAIIRSLPR